MPLGLLVRPHVKTGPESISHINQITSVTIFYNKLGFPAGTATDELEQAAKEIIPASVAGAPAGSSAQFIETVKAMVFLLIIAIFVMYIILGILYESYIHPITVFSTLPVASLGGLATLQLFGMPLDLYGFIGLFLLLGLIKKNGIMLVDFAIMRRRDGLGVEAARSKLPSSACGRFMTTFAAIFGALPMLGLVRMDPLSTTDGPLHCRRARCRTDPDLVLHPGLLYLYGIFPGAASG